MKTITMPLVVLSLVVPFSSAVAQVSFTNVSNNAQIHAQPEANPMAAGIAWFDYDNDGWQDIYAPNATGHDPYDGDLVNVGPSGPNRLYHNNGNGTFTEVAASAGVQLTEKPSLGVAVGDYNNDGFDDLFVTNAGTNTLFKNNGNGTFSDVTSQLGLDDMSKASFAASFGDIDGDGDLDIYVGHWTDDLAGGNPNNRANDLYINNGTGGFVNIAAEVGVNSIGATFTIPMTDFDHDKDLDLFVVNDRFSLWLDGGVTAEPAKGELFRNDGLDANGQLIFTPYAVEAGVNQQITGMGIAISDYDNDGDLDYYRSQFAEGLLSTNDGSGIFSTTYITDASEGAVGWGTVFVDVDNDGFVDLYRGNSNSASGNVNADAYQANNFYQNINGVFSIDTASQAGLESLNAGLGVASADFDNDGDLDIVVHGVDGVINLLRNDTITNNASLQISLKGNSSNKRGIGAKIFVVSGKGKNAISTVREVTAGSSHGSNNSFITHFGLNNIGYASKVTVEWPSGCVQVLRNVSAGLNEIVEDCTASHVITGRITHNGEGIAGVTVWDAYDYQNIRTVTDASGVFTLENYADNQQALIVIPGRDGFIPSDSLRYVPSVQGKDVVLADSIVTLKPDTVLGRVSTSEGVGVADVSVWNIMTYPNSIVSTDANGLYVLTDITAGENVWVNGTRIGMSMTLDSGNYMFTHEGVAIDGVDFTVTLKSNTVSGFIHDASGYGLADNEIWDAATYPKSIVTTDKNGFYVIPDMIDGEWVVLVPGPHPEYTILPSIDAFIKSPGAAVNHNFITTQK